jgi:hypothetical protein
MQLSKQFAEDRQGRRYADVLKLDLFQSILTFFDDPNRQRRMVESELHHDRPALAGVVRELEDQEGLDEFLATNPGHVTTRFRQAIGLVVRIIMENNGWLKTGRKGSLGVRTKPKVAIPKTGAATNTGGLSVWFTRAERYEPKDGMPFRSVEKRSEEIQLLYVLPFLEID